MRPTTAWIKVLAIDPIAVDDTATGVLVIAVVNMGNIFLQVVVLDIASAVIMIAIIVLDIHDNDLMIIPTELGSDVMLATTIQWNREMLTR